MALRFVFCLLLVLSLPLMADPITITLGGNYCTTTQGQAGKCSAYTSNNISFDGLAPGLPAPTGNVPSPQFFLSSTGPLRYSWTTTTARPNSPFVFGSSSGNYASPGVDSPDPLRRDRTDYLTIGSPTRPLSIDIDFLKPMLYFGFYIGSPDKYNQVQFTFLNNGTPIATFAGDQIKAPANQSWTVGEYVNFFSKQPFTKIVMSSLMTNSGPIAFETDNHAYGTPEPGSILLLGTCLLGVVGVIRRRLSV